MNIHWISFIFEQQDLKLQQERQQKQEDNTIKIWLDASFLKIDELEQILDNKISMGQVARRIEIQIGQGMLELKTKKKQKMEEDNLLAILKTILGLLNSHIILQQIESFFIKLGIQQFPVLVPIIEGIKNMSQLQLLSLQSDSSIKQIDFYTLRETISSSLVNLSKLHLNVAAISQDKKNSIQSNHEEIKQQLSLFQMCISSISQIEDLKIIKQFPNLVDISLNFPITFQNKYIEPALQEIVHNSPKLQYLKLEIIKEDPCYLSPVNNLKELKCFKLELKTKIQENTLDLSRLQHLIEIYVQCLDPFDFFSAQKNIPHLEKLTLSNVGGFFHNKNEISDQSIKKFQDQLSSHKELISLTIKSIGHVLTAERCLKRDLKIASCVLKQLKELEINLSDSSHFNIFGIDEEMTDILCTILEQVNQYTAVNLQIDTCSISIKTKCSLAVAIRKLSSVALFKLNGKLLIDQIKNFYDKERNILLFSYLGIQDFDLSQDRQMLLKIGCLTGFEDELTKTVNLTLLIKLMKDQIEQNNMTGIQQISRVLEPIQRAYFSNFSVITFPMNLCQFLSKNIVFLKLNYHLDLQQIENLSAAFPNLCEIYGDIYYEDDITPPNLNFIPNRNLRLSLFFGMPGFLNYLDKIFSIQGHSLVFNFQVWGPILNQAEIINRMFDSGNRILLYSWKDYPSCIREVQYQTNDTLTQYSLSVFQSTFAIITYFKSIAHLLPLNPKEVLYDL